MVIYMDSNRIRLKTLAFIYDTIHKDARHMWLRSLTPGQVRDIADLVFVWEAEQRQHTRTISVSTMTLEQGVVPLKDVERTAILNAVRKLGVKRAAEALGLGKTTIYRKLKEYEWDPERPEMAVSAAAAAGGSDARV